MKYVLNVIFYNLVGAGIGLAIGAYLGHLNQLWVIIPAITAGVFFIAALITTTAIVKAERHARNTNVTLQKKDIILQAGQNYTVGKRGKIRPGEYKVMTTDESNKSFNLRVNDYVKEYQHNTTLILAEGDTISARSANVILR
ncbi:MAG: hypothetical protein MJ060_02870 [Clostridia bacterium]|nr:hypothetical protein [Clostridia bacterium]